MKLWDIYGTPVSDFGTDGVLTIGASPALSVETIDLWANSYIAEIRLVDGNGDIALLREVVEIWNGTTTAIVFEPTVYLDPSAVLAYSGAVLSETSTIGGIAIGAGTGTGEDEDNPILYNLPVLDITNAALNFFPDTDSLFAAISWTATAGSVPGGTGYGTTEISDFSSDNVLWIKMVSEDGSTTRYYKFILALLDSDLTISGDGLYTYAGDTLRIMESGTYTIGMKSGVTTTTKNRIVVDSGLSANIILSNVDIDTSANENTAAFDMSGATVTLTLTGTNVLKSGLNRAGLQAPEGSTVTINAADETHTLSAIGGDNGAGIGGGMSAPNGLTGGSITITGGTVTATGGYRGAGIGGGGGYDDYSSVNGGAGGNITISGGTVTATGYGGAGIGGGLGGGSYATGGAGGNITITGGTVTATGGTDGSLSSTGAGIGGGSGYSSTAYGGAGGNITITGGIVTATGGVGRGYAEGGAGIGGGGAYGNGSGGSGGTVIIRNCMVIAKGGSGGAAGIGGGSGNSTDGAAGSITEIAGNAVVLASSIQPALPGGSLLSNALVYNGATFAMYGNVTLGQDFTINDTGTLEIPAFSTLTIPGGVTLTNNGNILVYHGGAVSGTVVGNQPVFSDLTISGGTSYAYAGGLLTITGNGTYTIGMKSGLTTTTTDRIVVAPGVTADITLSSVSIDMSGKANTAAFDMPGATVTLTLTGTNVLKSGNYRAGIQASGDSALTIDAANVTHTLTVTGEYNGAGINGGTITINGGMIIATGSVGIGSGTIAGISGGAIVYATSIQPAITEGVNATQAIVFNGAIGTMYGDITLQQDLTIKNTETLHIPAFNTLTIGDVTLTNNGTIIVYQRGAVDGTVTGNQPVDSVLTISGGSISSSSYTYTGGILTITEDGIYTIAMRSGVTIAEDDCIVVAPGVTADITLSNVHIEVWGNSAFDMSGATVNLTLVGTNILIGGLGGGPAGLHVPEGSTHTINASDTSHSLTAKSGDEKTVAGRPVEYYGTGAGIGGSSGNATGGNITINNGTVTAVGGYGAGIGGASIGGAGDGGTVTINGGIVTAIGRDGAGIGGGTSGNGGTVMINDGTVTASTTGVGNGCVGIGGKNGSVTIRGGMINATGGSSGRFYGGGAGIGGGDGTITITGGTVNATGGEGGYGGGAGIGGSQYRVGGIISITGGTIIATGGGDGEGIDGGGAGIGGGSGRAGGTVSITGGTVTATGVEGGAGIGNGKDGSAPGTITELSGNAVVFASSIAPTLTAGDNATQAIAFNGTAGTMYGNVTLQQDVTIPSTHTLNLSGGTLDIGSVTLTNDGTINKNGGTIVGTPAGSGTVNN
jgi:hypothetical protein